ncbi:MAG: pyruvate formate lyase family protein [Saccharofermentanales bacterium]
MSQETYASAIKEPGLLSPRVKWLRDYYFEGTDRKWNNQYLIYTTGTPWDVQFDELTYYIVPEMYAFMNAFTVSCRQSAQKVDVPEDFFQWSIPERKAWFTHQVVTRHMPVEILPGDLLCGGQFNLQYSMCLTKEEQKERNRLTKKAREAVLFLHTHGYGNCGATSGHLIPDYEKIVRHGFSKVFQEIEEAYEALTEEEKTGSRGAALRAMKTACLMPRELAANYAAHCDDLADREEDPVRAEELRVMAANMRTVPWEGAKDFYQAVQSLWFTHMLVMSDEKYPGPGVSFGRLDQYLYPFYQTSRDQGMTHEFMKDILGCFWVHCNTVYDAQIRVGGNQGITAGFGQLFNLSGLGPDGEDRTNDLTYLLLEVIEAMSPILEPKPNVRLHRKSPDRLLNLVTDMISGSQGAPFLLNFDERSVAGMLLQADRSGQEALINRDNVFDYAAVGCLENTMAGNDRSGTVDNNINLLKAMELVYGNGSDMLPYLDPMTGKWSKIRQEGPRTGTLSQLDTWDRFFDAYVEQTRFMVKKMVDTYEMSESIRAVYHPTPYLSLLVKGCIEQGLDVTQGGAELSYTTMEGVTFATTVDSLLAVKYLVYDQKECSLEELVQALKDNWEGHEILQAKALHRAPKYGRDEDESDALAFRVMEIWADEVWKHRTLSTGRQFRPGMLSWNYWIGSGYILKASANGRTENQFLSNAICPSNGADLKGPTANSNSVGTALGGKTDCGDYVNILPNGASHTITFNASLVRTPEHKAKLKSFLKGYCENGGTALQINILDPQVLKEAQAHPSDYRHLLVRVTGYNAYFTSIGKELQDEIIARESHLQY